MPDVKFWDIREDAYLPRMGSLRTNMGHYIMDVYCSSVNDNIVVRGISDGTMTVWDMRMHQEPVTHWLGYNGVATVSVRCSKFEERIIYIGGWNGLVQCWDYQRLHRHFVRPITWHQSPGARFGLQRSSQWSICQWVHVGKTKSTRLWIERLTGCWMPSVDYNCRVDIRVAHSCHPSRTFTSPICILLF
ncbi:hypothetical protein AMTR_s00058p00138270 [Amborella trichopoda]|uniref:Peroxin-7 n=1 Tax=Amborella trichopoda TaxID=13333 RepID=W1PHI3_AMBTC|nr:hypothetical protein AMTR_s00058p00138270 [Amborella trichopoda]